MAQKISEKKSKTIKKSLEEMLGLKLKDLDCVPGSFTPYLYTSEDESLVAKTTTPLEHEYHQIRDRALKESYQEARGVYGDLVLESEVFEHETELG